MKLLFKNEMLNAIDRSELVFVVTQDQDVLIPS